MQDGGHIAKSFECFGKLAIFHLTMSGAKGFQTNEKSVTCVEYFTIKCYGYFVTIVC